MSSYRNELPNKLQKMIKSFGVESRKYDKLIQKALRKGDGGSAKIYKEYKNIFDKQSLDAQKELKRQSRLPADEKPGSGATAKDRRDAKNLRSMSGSDNISLQKRFKIAKLAEQIERQTAKSVRRSGNINPFRRGR